MEDRFYLYLLQEKTKGFLLLSLRPLPLYFNLSCNCVISSTNKRGHGPNKAFLVPDSRRATERKGNSISAESQMTPLKTIRMRLVSVTVFSEILAGVLDFLILQDKRNMYVHCH